jgi:hypothetical protein
MWAEVKPGEFRPEEDQKCRLLADASGRPVLKLVGVPTFRPYWAVIPSWGLATGEPWVCDYLLDDQYLDSEHRFFGSSACSDPGDASKDYGQSPRTLKAYEAARSARFEHGESGSPGRRGRPGFPPGLLDDPQPAWQELGERAFREWFNAPPAVKQRMGVRWGIGAWIPRSEAEARAILADLERFAAEGT